MIVSGGPDPPSYVGRLATRGISRRIAAAADPGSELVESGLVFDHLIVATSCIPPRQPTACVRGVDQAGAGPGRWMHRVHAAAALGLFNIRHLGPKTRLVGDAVLAACRMVDDPVIRAA